MSVLSRRSVVMVVSVMVVCSSFASCGGCGCGGVGGGADGVGGGYWQLRMVTISLLIVPDTDLAASGCRVLGSWWCWLWRRVVATTAATAAAAVSVAVISIRTEERFDYLIFIFSRSMLRLSRSSSEPCKHNAI